MPSRIAYPGVYLEEIPGGSRSISGVPTGVAAFVGCTVRGPDHHPVRVGSFADFERVFGGLAPDSEVGYAVYLFFANGGREAWVVRTPCLGASPASVTASGGDGTTPPDAAAIIGDPRLHSGLGALFRIDRFDLLCLPEVSRPHPDDPGMPGLPDPVPVWTAALEICRASRALLLLDLPPQVQDVAAAVQWANQLPGGLKHPNVAAYFPRLWMTDPLDPRRLRAVAPSGAVAGLIARTDASRGVWKAPAGTDAGLAGVQRPVSELTDAGNAVLNRIGLNCLRSLPGHGTVCWGARTLASADGAGSEWKYIPVRRMALLLEESLQWGTRWAVFEPNDEPLWAQLRQSAGAFMHHLFRQGAFAGPTPKEAFFVKCDRETTPPGDVHLGLVHIEVGFAPLKPGEFVVLTIRQRAGQPSA